MTASCDSNLPLINQTFLCSSDRLPTIAQVKSHIYTDRKWVKAGEYCPVKHQTTRLVRECYVGQSFVLLTDEFIGSLQRLCSDFENIVELGAGIGWLGHWLTKYGVKIQASIDNKTWPDFPRDQYLGIVEEMDSLQYILLHPEVELFILAWPQEDDLANFIWQALRPDQYLLYIGEDRDGCTANNNFFDLVHNHEVESKATVEMRQSYLCFDDFYDQPHLYRKG